MMQTTAYRLAEYKIIENAHGDLWWEIHIGLGSLKSGKCFINGDILFMGVLVSSLVHRENLIKAMITGRKRLI